MPYFMVDDQMHLHRKVASLLEDEGVTGAAAVGLWTLAGSQSQAKLSDGYVTVGDATRLLLSRPLALKLGALLVKYGLWEQVDAGGWVFHDWRQVHKPGEQVKGERERRKELRTPEIVQAVRARDGDRCRYCGKRVNFADRKGERGGCYDHVDPGLVGGSSNIVVACRSCNSRKARRTPEQASMALLPAPNQPESNTGSRSDPDQDLDPGSDETTSPRARAGARSRAGLETGIETGPRGEVGAAGPVPPGAVPPPGQRPSPVGSGWAGWHGPPPDDLDDLATCQAHGLELPCRTCTADHYATEAADHG